MNTLVKPADLALRKRLNPAEQAELGKALLNAEPLAGQIKRVREIQRIALQKWQALGLPDALWDRDPHAQIEHALKNVLFLIEGQIERGHLLSPHALDSYIELNLPRWEPQVEESLRPSGLLAEIRRTLGEIITAHPELAVPGNHR